MPIPVRRTRFTTWRSLATAATAAALTATLLTPAVAGTPAPRRSEPVYSYDNAVREAVWVDTGLDGDRDGRTDRVAVDIVRPSEPDRRGRKIPVIMDASPYYSCCGRGNESQRKTYDASGNVVGMPLFYDNYFVPRGYAFVAVDLAGTNRSDGCVDVGGRSDVQSAKAVVDWLNGRGKAYTTRTGGASAKANWTNGRTGMIGKSYDGTIANAVAATGVEGLETIVPIGAISSWYDYYFAKGAPLYNSGPEWLSDYVESPDARAKCGHVQQELVDGAPRTGDLTRLWTERDHVKDVRKIEASVFVIHGQQDLNVRPQHFGQWWDALAKHGVERRIWLSQTGHVDPFDFRRAQWVDTLHRWFDHELLGYDNGVDDEPMADVERHPNQWETSKVWPPRATKATTLRPAEGSEPGVGTLGLRKRSGTETFTDDPALNETDWAAYVDRPTPDKAGFVTPPLTEDLRLSGSSQVTVTATPTTSTAHLSAVLVDLGPDTVRDYAAAGEGITTLTERTCWGPSTTGDSSCFRETRARTADVDYTIFSRGWADLGNHSSGTGAPLTPGTPYTITLDLHASDHVVPAGHRLALIIAGTDEDLIDPPSSTPTLTIDLRRTSAKVPLVGGAAAFRKAITGATGTPAASVLDGVRDPSRAARIPGGAA
ncbi:Xaa-Pro dipeptidyl-peptidase [Streptomyces europaeiscabiei]|uniref:Xaa-Pro dipeptidyl-peptidase n=1 Tax=Streptomyces europaeiscabiei TaxID=146819 RepID=A0ABU4NX20_9ACTN|nr:Xaa-Pro dipeptidyl-peptidase [Streptomyces europaeiscabiei]MDX2527201.1 Xaa-Pro dipeptidyl-peptidase [Streptomyces europaeiscabiei]MDX2770049.1 Xaa-Pro dipeptidyl-peptidase [Streptomyces europaeiscabiei]MDX3542258.1 Xaa-Pro dipeptidyl-peptidase [Streptomyces europaeiscabiei]MDX3551306.1 Xaa-Pro dipeptidyl-peptidase [Streptomyces europaeiscabiei]MDX3665476.1 Xaa-Pro dipeptidyl-peptidase [Streptomyces europaeiscabiei]